MPHQVDTAAMARGGQYARWVERHTIVKHGVHFDSDAMALVGGAALLLHSAGSTRFAAQRAGGTTRAVRFCL
jgi:hypothetical protein